MDETVKEQVKDLLIARTRHIIETVFFDIMYGVQPKLAEVMPNNVDTDNLSDFTLEYCSEVLAQEVIVEGTITAEEAIYITMLIYPALMHEDLKAKIDKVIPENHLQRIADLNQITAYRGKHLAQGC